MAYDRAERFTDPTFEFCHAIIEKLFKMKSIFSCPFAVMVATSGFWAGNESLRAAETDGLIQSLAKTTYVFKTILRDDSITTVSKEGAVVLTGTVAVVSHKWLAGDTLWNLPGVISVDNQLLVKVPDTDDKSDVLLGAKVKTALLIHRQLSPTGPEVVVKAGVVSLRGEAPDMSQKLRTAEYVRDVEGVIDVINEITIGGNPRNAGEATLEQIDDASITALVKEALRAQHSTTALKTGIETSAGVVTLSGPAKTTAQKSIVNRLVADINGVIGVIDNTTVEVAVSERTVRLSAPQNLRIVFK